MNRERPQHNEIQPMSQKRRWIVRAGAETIAAVGLGLGIASGYETVADQNPDITAPLLVSALGVEAGAGVVILKQLTAEKKNKEYLGLQLLLNQRKGLIAALHYRLEERGLIKSQEERSGSIDIPDVFRNAFDNENPEDNNPETV